MPPEMMHRVAAPLGIELRTVMTPFKLLVGVGWNKHQESTLYVDNKKAPLIYSKLTVEYC